MNGKRRSTAVLIALMLLTVLAILTAASAEESLTTQDGAYTYTLRTDPGTGESYAVITNAQPMRNLVIPSDVDGYPVREVGDWFSSIWVNWQTELDTLTIQEGVTAIGANAFPHCAALKEVTFPSTLVSIGEAAFMDCPSLETVSLPASLRSVGEAAFAGIGAEILEIPEAARDPYDFVFCGAIRTDKTGAWEYGVLEDGTAVVTGFVKTGESLEVPATVDGLRVTMVARVPLADVDYVKLRGITSAVLPEGLKAVQYRAFEFCENMTEITVPDSVEYFGLGVFRKCQTLQSVRIPEGVRRIGESAFEGCSKLAAPEFPSTLTEIRKLAFFNCRKLGAVTIPGTVPEVCDQAFGHCEITELTLEEGVTVIGERAFFSHNCAEIVIPSSVETVGTAAFHPNGNKRLTAVAFLSPKTKLAKGVFGYDDGWSAYYQANKAALDSGAPADFDKNDQANWFDYYADSRKFGQNQLTVTCYPGSKADQLYQYFVVKNYLEGNPDNQKTAAADRVLKAGLYSNDDLIYELIIPEGVEELADHALEGMGTIRKITIPSTLTRIGAYAFDRCIGLEEIILPEGLTEIGEGAFRDCYELLRVNIPDGITEICDRTFENCKKLSSIKIPKEGIRRIGHYAFSGCAALTALPLNKGLEEIGDSAFARSGLTDVEIPDTVTSVGKSAFAHSAVQKLKLPVGLTEIPDRLCEFATDLTNVKMPKTYTRIGARAFTQSRLKNINLPEGLTSIGEYAFSLDQDSVLAYYRKYVGKRTMSNLKSVKFPASLRVIEKGAFAGCDALSSVSFAGKSQLETIGDEAFAMCFRLSKIVIPNTTQTIGKLAFQYCQKLSSADLGKSLTALGDEAFSNCIGMTTLKAPGTLTEIGDKILKNHHKRLKVSCPDGSPMHTYITNNYRDVKLTLIKK